MDKDNTKHTPGPWTIEEIGHDDLYGHVYISGHITSPLHTYCGNTVGRTDSITAPDSMTRGDALLIASSPELADQLERQMAINAAMAAWLDEEDLACTANVPDSGGRNECDHCTVRGMLDEAGAAIRSAEAVLIAAGRATEGEVAS